MTEIAGIKFSVWFDGDPEGSARTVVAFNEHYAAERFVDEDFWDDPRDDEVGRVRRVFVRRPSGGHTEFEVAGEVSVSWAVRERFPTP